MAMLFSHERLAAPALSASPAPSAQQGSSLQNFLTPEAMLTPGIAGAITMTIANTLYVSFGAPPPWTALILSFTFGVLVLAENRRLIVRAVLYVLNSLVIFCMAWGVNSVGNTGKTKVASLSPPAFVRSAFAQATGSTAAPGDARDAKACADASSMVPAAQVGGASPDDVLKLLAPCRDLSRSIAAQRSPDAPREAEQAEEAPAPRSRGFFAPWKF